MKRLKPLYADNLEPHHFALGMHYREAELWEEAFTSLRRAGAAAMARSACREAVVCFEQALAVERHLPETDERAEQEIDLRRQLGASLFTLGELDRVLGHLRDAERLARTLSDQKRIGWVSAQLSLCYWVKGVELTQARRFGETALAIGEALADACLIVAASVPLGSICHYLSELRQAEDFFQMGLRALRQGSSREPIDLTEYPAVTLRARLAQILAMRGEFQEGITHGQEAMRIAEELDHPNSLIQACHSLGFLYRTKGDLSRATYLYERSLELSDKWNVTFWSPRLSFQLGYVYALSGRVPEALSLLRSANSSFESIYHQPPPDGIIYLGEACMLVGQFDEARGLAERGLALARNLGRPVSNEALSLCLLAEIARRGDPSDIAESEAWYRQALGIAEELGTRPMAARCHLGLGRLYRKAGRQQEARRELGAAAEEFSSMEMTFWLDQAEAEATRRSETCPYLEPKWRSGGSKEYALAQAPAGAAGHRGEHVQIVHQRAASSSGTAPTACRAFKNSPSSGWATRRHELGVSRQQCAALLARGVVDGVVPGRRHRAGGPGVQPRGRCPERALDPRLGRARRDGGC